jgi:cytochrome c oxidase cbb3-type subunit 3
MKLWRTLFFISLAISCAGIIFLTWQKRPDHTTDVAPRYFSSFDVAEGKRLYTWFNCHTCHANGGGDIGPALMDKDWLYGAEAEHIFKSIIEGRPNGMPSFRGKIPDAQVWQIAAYVRSMAGHIPSALRSSRNDDIQSKDPETLKDSEEIRKKGDL